MAAVRANMSFLEIIVMPRTDQKRDDTYSEEETVARREATLKRMLATPHKPHKVMKRKRSDVKDSHDR
jgi:hypothetical protein